MTPLEDIVRRRIAQGGPMPLSEYMSLCLAHPAHGYYITRDPLGVAGDFTTAPEVSQMFGELIGLWLAQAWIDLGRPPRATLAELGPGRGTLMADALRAAASVPGFLDCIDLWLVETSPALRARQAEALAPHAPRWADDIEALPDAPLLLVANEFLDALPIRQFHRVGGRWRERVVGLDGDRLAFGLGSIAPFSDPAPDGAVREVSPIGEAIARRIGARLAARGGAALLVDYGDLDPGPAGGDTFQAVRGHAYADPLASPGEADLTAHVDFAALARAAEAEGAVAWPGTTQGAWLERMGIVARARSLARAAAARSPSPEADPVEAIVAAHRRLTHPAEMGQVFKVLALTGPDHPRPAGI